MLALIAGTGALPAALLARINRPVIVCAMDGFGPEVPVDLPFRIEHLGSFLNALTARGVTEICMAGAVRRPVVDPAQIDAATLPLVPQIQAAIAQGDDGALRAIIAIFESYGMAVKAAHDIAPDLLPPSGVLTSREPPKGAESDARAGAAALLDMGAADRGQACVVCTGDVIAREGPDGTDAMLASLDGHSTGAILFKGPKPQQDRRADLPVIGPETVAAVIAANLAGIVIVAGGVMVLDRGRVVDALNAAGKFLWVRESETP